MDPGLEVRQLAGPDHGSVYHGHIDEDLLAAAAGNLEALTELVEAYRAVLANYRHAQELHDLDAGRGATTG